MLTVPIANCLVAVGYESSRPDGAFDLDCVSAGGQVGFGQTFSSAGTGPGDWFLELEQFLKPFAKTSALVTFGAGDYTAFEKWAPRLPGVFNTSGQLIIGHNFNSWKPGSFVCSGCGGIMVPLNGLTRFGGAKASCTGPAVPNAVLPVVPPTATLVPFGGAGTTATAAAIQNSYAAIVGNHGSPTIDYQPPPLKCDCGSAKLGYQDLTFHSDWCSLQKLRGKTEAKPKRTF